MADQAEQHERTEEPTQRKLDDARKKGDVAKSQEVNSWFLMVGATLVCTLLAGDVASSLARVLQTFLGEAHDLPAGGEDLRSLLAGLGERVLGALALPFAVLAVAGIAGNVFQQRLIFSAEPLKPKLSKISPAAGFKRLASPTSLVNFAKALAKLVIVGSVMAAIAWPMRERLDGLISTGIVDILIVTQATAGKVMVGVLVVLAVVAALDYAYQRHKWWEKQRMTIKELRDEYKQLEGDPQVRAKLRQVRIERGRKRMMANVKKAAVVIANPTHYSIALQYETGMSAPVCVAKGRDAVALKIRQLAKEHGVPLVENPPLARTLYTSVELDEEIPHEHYKAVAEVIGYVMQLRRGSSWRSRAGSTARRR